MGMTKASGAAAALAFLLLGLIVPQAMAGSSQGTWFQVGLTTGQTNGYKWSAGAKGLKGKGLSRICTEISMAEPPRNGTDVGEGRDATDCGELKAASDAVVTKESLGPKKSGITVLEAIYRPLVRKVAIVFAGGKRMALVAQAPKNGISGGVPAFRYVATSFGAGDCVDRIVAFDGKGKVVSSQVSPPC
jgi:hypothetical protein